MQSLLMRKQSSIPIDEYLRRLGWQGLFPALAFSIVVSVGAISLTLQRQADELHTQAARLAAAIDAELERRVHGLRAMLAIQSALMEPSSPAEWYRLCLLYDRTFDTPMALVENQKILLLTRLPEGAAIPPVPEQARVWLSEESLAAQVPIIGGLTLGPTGRLGIPMILPLPDGPSRALISVIPQPVFQAFLSTGLTEHRGDAKVIDASGHVLGSKGSPFEILEDTWRRPHHATVHSQRAGWTIHVRVDPWAFYLWPALAALALTVGAALAFAGATRAAQRSGRHLAAGLKALAYGQQPTLQQDTAGCIQHDGIIEIEQIQRELERLTVARQDAEMAERYRIAQDLHDGVQQAVAAVKIHLDLMAAQIGRGVEVLDLLHRARIGVNVVLREIRQVARNLQPRAIAQKGLIQALDEMAASLRESCPLQIEVELLGDDEQIDDLPDDVANVLYRVTQECLTNVLKHAQASFVLITLDATSERCVHLSVSDDGIGIADPLPAQVNGLGLKSMHHRSAAVGGSLQVRRGHGDDATVGTTVTLTVPRIPGLARAGDASAGRSA